MLRNVLHCATKGSSDQFFVVIFAVSASRTVKTTVEGACWKDDMTGSGLVDISGGGAAARRLDTSLP
jgi:hypothetical protein